MTSARVHPNRPAAVILAAHPTPALAALATLVALAVCGSGAQAQEATPSEGGPQAPATSPPLAAPPVADQTWAVHAQATAVGQGTFAFRSPYRGTNSLDPGARARETVDLTLYAGLRLWRGAQVWINPEVDQGFGLSNTLGVAGFPSGEAYKVGQSSPYIRLQRAFLRQTFDLGGETQNLNPDQNVLGGSQSANRLVITAGKLSVGDVFDANAYAHDPRGDFMNWTVIDAGTFDYAADAWGYTYGLAGEWYQGPWVLRAGLFDMSKDPNGEKPDSTFTQFQMVAEGERDYALFGHPGKLRVTGFLSRARMGGFADALRLAAAVGTPPNVLAVRRYQGHGGISVNLEQSVADGVGVFARAGLNDGHQQSYEFTDVNQTVSAGVSIQGKGWGRADDVFAVAGVVNDISGVFRAYLNAGGLGILVGDGRLPHPGSEGIVEAYYDLAVAKALHLTLDYQFIANPAYNRDRGPVSVLGVRAHTAL